MSRGSSTGRGARAAAIAATAALIATTAAPATAQQQPACRASLSDGALHARATATEIALGNDLAERRWSRDALRTVSLVDRRGEDRAWTTPRRDFTLRIAGATVTSEDFAVTRACVVRVPRGGLRVTMELAARPTSPAAAPLRATRTAEVYRGVAGFRTQTTLQSTAPLPLSAATLDEAATGPAAPTIHAFRAGADWREPDWSGPPVFVGDPHAGTWRDTHTAAPGEALEGPAQWLSTEADGRSLFMVMERNDFPSSRARYDGTTASVGVEYARDVLDLGPLEENAHVENPTGTDAGRARLLRPGVPFELEAAFTGFGSTEADEPWQFNRYLSEHRLAPYPKAVTFNSNGTDSNRISTGAKDDMDIATVREVAPIARRLGVETFILDDGWQAVSGDWEPDSPEHPEPRWDGNPDSKFAPRFPDSEFRAVRDAIAPMRLGLWMSPMHFNPESRAFREHPEWACGPVGHALAVANALEPESGSNEAGIGEWGPDAIPYVESRIRRAIEDWDVTYFKFDFLAWLDCAGQGDLHDYHDAFVAMLDRLRTDHPEVTFQIDETNDYRLFPFESVSRGQTCLQKSSPGPERLLHNVWNLSPYVPAYSLGQHVLGGGAFRDYPVDTLMAAALTSHITFFDDLRQLPADVIDPAAPWLAFYRENRDALTQMTYPLLDDPLQRGWTALQPWNPATGDGALLAFRQDSDETARTIALENVPPGRRFRMYEGPSGAYLGTVSSSALSEGITVELPEKRTARVLVFRSER